MYLIDVTIVDNLRKKKNLSKRKLGKMIGYRSESAIYNLLSSGVVRSRFKVLALCKVLGCEPEGLLVHPKRLEGWINE